MRRTFYILVALTIFMIVGFFLTASTRNQTIGLLLCLGWTPLAWATGWAFARARSL